MNKIFLLTALMLFAEVVNAQQISLQAGQSFSKLKFVDSNGVELENLQSVNHFYMMAEFRTPLFSKQLKNKLLGNVGLRFNGYGATGSDRALDNYFEWDLSYLGLVFGADYEFYSAGRFTGFISVKPSIEWMVRGSQVINKQVYNLMGNEDFDSPMFFFRGGLGAKFELTSDASIFISYMAGKAYTFSNDPAKLNILAQNFGVGIFADIAVKKRRR